jgi:hypothetical protein
MLDAAVRRHQRHSAWWSVGIAGLGLLNLLACAYLERFIGEESSGDGFMMFLAMESFFLVVTGAAVVNSELEVIARRTRTFPLTAAARHDFVFLALLRHRAMVMITGTALFAGAIVGQGGAIPVAGRVFMISLLMLMVFALMSTLTILRIRPGAATRSVLAFTGLAAAGFLVITAVVSPGPVLNILLPLRWAAAGASEIQHGQLLSAMRYALYLVSVAGACVWIGRRYA